MDSPADRILAAAVDALSTLDPAAVSIHRICSEAAVTPPTLYHHYGNKDGLIAAAVDKLVAGWLEQMDQLIVPRVQWADTAEAAVSAWAAMIADPSRPLAVFSWLALWSPGRSEEVRASLVRARTRAESLAGQVLLSQGLPQDRVTVFARLVVDQLLAAGLNYELDHDSEQLRLRLLTLTDLMLAEPRNY